MEPDAVSSAVRSAAREIRRDLLKLADGEFVGSEDMMVERYGVSRPTLRQAAALLAQEQLLTIRRGVGGGYFARLPTTQGVAHAAAVYLVSHEASMREIIEAVAPIKAELATLACRCSDEVIHRQLLEYADAELPEGENFHRTFLRSERHFSRILSKMSGNKVLSLFLSILYDYCAQIPPEQDVYRHHPERVRAYWTARSRLVQSILDGDEQVAAVVARRLSLMVAGWMAEGSEAKSVTGSFAEMLEVAQANGTSGSSGGIGTHAA
jgi:DNA-binding FadR family transcriptional regulator